MKTWSPPFCTALGFGFGFDILYPCFSSYWSTVEHQGITNHSRAVLSLLAWPLIFYYMDHGFVDASQI